ncbi:MAG TPA: PEGA domain-containing protein [Leptospiraceae bacterium]|nr:PEGA domain-containing protein [Leptospiraceae bacterium]
MRGASFSFLFASVFFPFVSSLLAVPPVVDRPPLRANESKIVLLPFSNESRETTLDYLRSGIPESLAGYFSSVGYIEDSRAVVYVMRTQGAPGQGVLRETTRDNLFADVDTVKLTPEIYQAVESGDMAGVARRLSARYVVRGSFRADPEEKVTEARRLHVDAEIYDGRTGQKTRNSIETKVDSLHEDLAGMATGLRAVIRVPQKFKTSFESADPGIMVYLDERFLGRTPFEIELPAGTFFMRLEQEGKTGSSRNLTVSGPARVNLQLGEKLLKCMVSVLTEPEGASVYLDLTLIGKSPLLSKPVPCGAHRIRTSLEGHVDRFAGVELAPDGPVKEVVLSMVPGDTVKTFRDPGYVVLDWTRKDISFYAGLNSLVFAGGWAYFNNRAEKLENSVRPTVPYLAFWQTPYLTLYQGYLLEQNRLKVLQQQRNAKTSAWIGAGSLIFSGIMLWRHYEVTTHESGEISMPILETGPDTGFARSATWVPARNPGHRVDLGIQLTF